MSFVKLASVSGAQNKAVSQSTKALSPLSKTKGMSILSKSLAEKIAAEEAEKDKNQGGFWGGLGYVGEKLGLGIVSAVEGVWDYAVGGAADLFGADRWAERQFANDWVNYSHADEWYNPGTGWKIAGDVAGGIGTSVPAIGMAFIPGPGWVGTAATIGTTFLSGAGNATKEAYKETGKLEYGYGALVGATEAGVELASAGIGTGTGRIVKAAASRNAAKQTAKQVTKTVSKTGAKQIAKKIGADFASEAIEEGLSEILTPQWQKVTYNPDAENASIEEIAYASLVGGLSGAIMTGSAIGIKSGINTVDNLTSGRKSMKDGTVSEIIKDGKAITDLEIAEDTGIEPNMSSKQSYESLMASLKKRGINTAEEAISLAEQGALKLNVKEQMYLGKLKKSNAIAAIYPEIERAFLSIVYDPKTSAERYSKLGMKYENGQKIKITEKEILEGIDQNLLEKARANTLTEEEAKAFAKNYRKALSENSVLATVAAAEATGRIMVNSKKISDSLIKDQNLANGVDIYRFIKTASPKRKQAVAEAFGIEDWDTLTSAELAEKITEFRENGGTTKIAKQMQKIREAEAHRADVAMPMPQSFKEDIADGFYKFKDTDGDIGVFKEGNEYFIFNYETKDVSKPLTMDDVNAYISRNRENSELISEQNNDIIKEKAEAENESEDSVRLRNGGKWNGSKNTKEQISRVESGSRQAESRRKASRIADSEAARLIDKGREVKISELGILDGSNTRTVRIVNKASETASMKKARQLAEERGLKVTFFLGNNLLIKEDGKWISVRAYIKGNDVFVRADHPLYTSEQLIKHEIGHDMIAKGEVNIDAVRERLADKDKDKLAKLYADAYEGTGMTPDEIWEECICDSLGDMNIFAGEEAIGTFFNEMLPEIKAVASESKSPTQTRGSPQNTTKPKNATTVNSEKIVSTVTKNNANISKTNSKPKNKKVEQTEKQIASETKKVVSILKKAPRNVVGKLKGQTFVSDGIAMISVSDAVLSRVETELGKLTEVDFDRLGIGEVLNKTEAVTEIPTEYAFATNKLTVVEIKAGKQKGYFNKKLLSKFDGKIFSLGKNKNGFSYLVATETDGELYGILLPMRMEPKHLIDGKPTTLKSFVNKTTETEGKASREIYSKHDKALYAAGVSFLHKNFPPENERLSEAHRLAVWWARKPNTETGDQTIIVMNDIRYLVECFDDALNYYQVEDVISKEEFDIIFKEIKEYGRSGQVKSVQGIFDEYDKFHKSNNSSKAGKSSVDSDKTRYGRKDSELVRVASSENKGRERYSSNGSRDSQSSSEDRQKYSRELDTDSTEYKINTSMTMAEAKRMIETAYKVNGIAEYYEDEYKDAEDWLKKAGSDEVEMYIENDYDLQAKYINSNEDILNEEYSIRDVLDAYLAGTLIGKEKPKPKRLDVSQSTRLKDDRFYSPQKIEDAKVLFELANRKAVGKDANAINRARAEILLFAHNKGAAELLGVTQSELNKKLRSWSNYSATAKSISERINAGVAEENRWTGIENSSYISKARVTDEDIERLVASVEGESKGYQRKYIARVMLAADTHIDYSGLKFKFASSQQVNADNSSGGRVLGFYDDTNRLIEVTHDKPHTVAHEMGHYIDAQWGRDLVGSTSSHLFLTHGVNADIVRERYGEQGVQFLNNFKLFINSLSDVNQNYNSYYNDRKEIFARFFARFIEWTDNIATGNKYYSYESTMYNDKFTQAQFVEFARLLQEKALLDGTMKENRQHGKASRELDDEYSRIYSMKSEVNQLREDIRKIEASDDFKAQMDKLSEAVANDNVVDGVKAYEEWKKISGYGELVSKRDTLLNDISRLTEEYEKKRESRAIEEEKAAIAKSGLSEADYFRRQAVKEFGYTPYFYDAGYILPNGKMLNFSGEKSRHFGSRGEDHRAIGIIYENTQGTAALVRFMNDGNIRIMAESPGLDISSNLEPTREQYSIIRSFIYEYANQEYFNIDLSDEGGNVIGSLEYDGRINPTRIINDVKHYYETGEIRAQSNVDKFRYSRELDTERESYAPDFEIASGSIEMLERPSYKERIEASLKSAKSGFVPGVIATEIQFTNVQAGVEHAGKVLGVKNIEALVQSARASRAQAQEMLGGGQWYIPPGASADKAVRLGDGLEPILSAVRDKRKGETKENAMERYSAFQYYLAHKHNVDRMSLEQKSLDENKADVERYEELKKELLALSKKIKANKASKEALKGKYNKASQAERTRLKAEISSDTLVFNVKSKAFTELKKKIDNFVPEENKPVLRKQLEDGTYEAITATESKDIVKLYEKKYSEFKEVSEKLYKFLNNLLKIQADSGLITQELYEELLKKYPHYVPTYRVEHKLGTAPIRGKGNIEVTQTVRKATGSLEALEDFELSISRLVQKAVSASNVNILGNALVNAAESKNSTTYIKEVSRDKADNLLENGELEQPKNNQISIYRNGERITYAVTHEVFLGFDSFNTKDESYILPVRAMAKATSLFKTLVTSANPIFLVRNFVRDLQDAGINTNYSLWNFAKHYVKAIKHLASNSEMAQLYRAAGGFSASIFDYVDGFVGKQSKMGFTNSTNKTKWLLNKIENLNMFVEQLPRFAEFLCAVESGKSVDQAILEAADVTTNFGRSGKLTKTLNNTVIPFLNPAVQGLSKIYRNIKAATKSWKAAAALIVKCIILGITPMVLNNLLYNDDDDYKEIKDTDKENNYLFRVGDTWLKVPKGRVVSVLAGAANRTGKAISGENPDVKGYLKNVVSQVTPVENITRPIWQPIFDAKNNKTWYGGEIEGRQFENVRPSQRYDESTSEIAKWLGEKFNYSPKKIHYVLDQYSGVIGDFVLPATTQKAQKSFVVSAFVFDPVTSNKLSDDFYKLYEEAKYKKSEGDETAKYQLKHLNEVKSAISDMYDEISKIQQSDLSNAEKLQQTRVIRVLINNAYKTARDDYELYTEAIELTAGHYDESTSNGVSMRYAEINRQVYGAEKALETYSSKVYEKMQYLNLSGIDYETLYAYYFGTKDIENDLDKNGEVISGSKRKKTVEAISRLKLTREQKLLLICASGYAIQDGDVRGVSAEQAKKFLLQYILKLNATKEQKEELARICGFEVKNGKIVLKNSSSKN